MIQFMSILKRFITELEPAETGEYPAIWLVPGAGGFTLFMNTVTVSYPAILARWCSVGKALLNLYISLSLLGFPQ